MLCIYYLDQATHNIYGENGLHKRAKVDRRHFYEVRRNVTYSLSWAYYSERFITKGLCLGQQFIFKHETFTARHLKNKVDNSILFE